MYDTSKSVTIRIKIKDNKMTEELLAQEGKGIMVKQAAEKFYTFLNVKDQPQSADVIFILGGSSLKPVEKAAELFWAGYAPKIVFISTGGRFGGEKIWGVSENEKYKQVLLENGVPEEAIITEGKTTNTLTEAQATVPFLREHGIDPKKMILVSRPIHQRRAYSTFIQQYPDIQYINCPADEPLNLKDPEEVTRLVQEAERLLDYGVKKTDIKRPEIPYETLRAAAVVRKYLKSTGVYQPRIKPSIQQE